MKELVFINNSQALTTSLLVAEKFGKEHKHVLEAIRILMSTKAEKSGLVDNQQLAKMFALTEREQPMPVGGGVKKTPMYVMNRDGFTLLAMGFTGEKALHFKLEYINAFNEMERKIKEAAGLPRTFAEALRLAADQQERIEAQQRQLEEQHPKVEYFDALVDRKLNLSFRDTAKEIGIRQNDFINLLIQKKYIFRDAKRQLKPHAAYVGTLFVIKECKAGDRWAGNQTLVTPKGRETFNILFASH